MYFDFFLFSGDQTKDPASSEIGLFNALISSGKDRFLIHPIFEIFLKLKWYGTLTFLVLFVLLLLSYLFCSLRRYRTWFFYMIYILLYFVFLTSLIGYTLAHFGHIYDDQISWDYKYVVV